MTAILISREPVLNRSRAITANRLTLHAAPAPGACQASPGLNRLADIWPAARTVFVSLDGPLPDAGLLDWQVPPTRWSKSRPPPWRIPQTQADAGPAAGGVALNLDGYSAGVALPPGVEFRFVLAEAGAAVAGAPGLLLAKGLADNAQFDVHPTRASAAPPAGSSSRA
jgi:hypothetical protein